MEDALARWLPEVTVLAVEVQPNGPRLTLGVHGDQHVEVDRLLSLGATRIDTGQGEAGRVLMADPDGNEFCVLTPR